MAGFGAKSEDIKISKPFQPEIYQNVRLIGVESKKQKEYDVLVFTFQKEDNAKWQHTIFEPKKTLKNTDQQVEDSKSLAGQQVVYIAKIVYDKPVNLALADDASWEDFRVASVNLFKQAYNNVLLELKLVGNYYNNNLRFGVTNYFGWLRRMDDTNPETVIEYSASELKANKLYYGALRNTPNEASQVEVNHGGTSSFIRNADDEEED